MVLCSEVGRLAPNLVQCCVRLSRHLLHKKTIYSEGTEKKYMCPKETLTQKYQAHLCEILRGTTSSGAPRDLKAMHLLWRGCEKSICI